jgi:hypothetical protein
VEEVELRERCQWWDILEVNSERLLMTRRVRWYREGRD